MHCVMRCTNFKKVVMNNLNSLSYYAQVVIGEELWISNSRFNGLYKVNLESGKSVYIGKFPQYRLDNSELHFFAKKYGEKIYFFPKCASGIDIYDLETGDFSHVECQTGSINNYVTAIDAFRLDEDNILIIPCYSGMTLQEFSIKKKAITKKIELIKSNQYVRNEANTMSLYACKMMNEVFYPLHETNMIGSYNLKKGNEKIYLISGVKSILGDIVFDGRNIWINADRGIYQWNPHSGDLNFVCDCSAEKEGWIEQFILYDQYIICVPRWLKNIKIIDRYNFEQKEIHIDKNKLNKNKDMPWRDIRESFVWRDKLIISPIKYEETIWIDLNSYEITYKKWEPLKVMSIQEDFLIHEIAENDLEDYIRIIDENEKNIRRKDTHYVGYNILQKI